MQMVPELFTKKKFMLAEFQSKEQVKTAEKYLVAGYGIDKHIDECKDYLQAHYPHPW